MNWVTFNYACVEVCICDAQHSFKSQFIEKGFKKAENYEQNAVLQLFLFTLKKKEETVLVHIC